MGKCYCCKNMGFIVLPVGTSSVYCLCRKCYNDYKSTLKKIRRIYQKTIDK